jgi:outer membrane protein, heavy metal efflux system
VAFGYQLEAAEGRLQQAGLRPNPELGVTVEDAFGNDTHRSIDRAETTVTLGWLLERGVRPRIVDVARADLSLHRSDADVVRLDVGAETARRFLACLAFQERLRMASLAVGQTEETVRRIAERVAAGRALEAEQARAEADLVRAELLQEDYEHELLSAYHRLSAQWGQTEPDFSSVVGNLWTLPTLESFEGLLSRIDANPEHARLLSEQRLAEAELRLAQSRRLPSWEVSVGVRRFESSDDFAIVGGVTIPLPVRDRNQGRISEARAGIERIRVETTASRVRIETTLFVLYQELNHNLQRAARLEADVLPRLERALADTRRAYELGRSGYSEWRVVQAELLDARSDGLQASIEAHEIVLEIERLTGVRMAPGASQ